MICDTNGRILSRVAVYGGFTLVANLHPINYHIEALCCTCGWITSCSGMTDSEAIEEAITHAFHEDYIKTAQLYKAGKLSYDGALGFLTMLGMDDSRAESYLDGLSDEIRQG